MFELWSGCYSSEVDHRALLACVALKGHHSEATYMWFLGEEALHESTPLLYTDQEGVYECKVKCGANTHSRCFQLTCKF